MTTVRTLELRLAQDALAGPLGQRERELLRARLRWLESQKLQELYADWRADRITHATYLAALEAIGFRYVAGGQPERVA